MKLFKLVADNGHISTLQLYGKHIKLIRNDEPNGGESSFYKQRAKIVDGDDNKINQSIYNSIIHKHNFNVEDVIYFTGWRAGYGNGCLIIYPDNTYLECACGSGRFYVEIETGIIRSK